MVDPAAFSSTNKPLRTSSWKAILCLTLFGLAIAVARLHTYDEPLERDLAIYTIIGKEMLAGRGLYSDLWDHKPPGVYLAYAAAQAVTPGPRMALYGLGVLLAIATMAGLWRLIAAWTGDRPWLALWGAGTWALICGSMELQANQPNVEAFLNAGLVWFLVACGRPSVSQPAIWVALTSIFKQIVAVNAIIVLWLCRGWRALIPLFAAGVAAWGAVAAYFQVTGHWREFYQTVFEYNRLYAGSIVDNCIASLEWQKLWPECAGFLWPLALLTVVGTARGDSRHRAILVGLIVGTQLQIAMPGKFFPHYYQLWMPVLVLGAAWGLAQMAQTKLAMGLAAAVLAVLGWQQLPHYRLSAEEWSRAKYGEEFVQDQHMGRELRQLLKPGESLYQWGSQPSLYVEAGLSPPSGVFFALPLQSREIGRVLQERLVADLTQRPPDLVVITDEFMIPMEMIAPALRHMLEWDYVPLDKAARYGRYRLLGRRGSALVARLDVKR